MDSDSEEEDNNLIKIGKSFEKPDTLALTKDQSIDAPAFDMIRASVNLMVAGVLRHRKICFI